MKDSDKYKYELHPGLYGVTLSLIRSVLDATTRSAFGLVSSFSVPQIPHSVLLSSYFHDYILYSS